VQVELIEGITSFSNDWSAMLADHKLDAEYQRTSSGVVSNAILQEL
jgi:hypothetical protein